MSAKFYSISRSIVISSLLTTVSVLAISFQDSSNQLNLFPNITGNAKIDSLNNYASSLNNSDSDLRMQIGQKCYSLSKSNDYGFGIIQSLNNISKSYNLQENTDSAIITGKKALTFIENNENLSLSAELNANIANLYSSQFQLDSTFRYYSIANGYAVKLKDSTLVSNYLNSLGIVRWRQGRFNNAIQLYKAGLKYNQNLGVDSLIVKSLNNIGAAYYHLGNKELALEYFINASEVRRRYNSLGSPVVDNNIGLIYLDLNDTLMAFKYFENALNIAKKTNHTLGEGYSYLNFGDLYFKQKKYSKAVEYYNKSRLSYEKLNDINADAKILNKIGQVYFETNKIKLAETKFLGAYKKSKVNGLKLTQTESLINLCQIQVLYGKNEKIISNKDDTRKKLDLAFELAREGDFVNSTLKIYLLNSQFYEILKDYKNSLKYHQYYNNLKDSLFNEQRIRIVSNTKSKYDADRKEKENNHLKFVNNIQKLEIENKQQEKVYIITFTVFSFFLIIYLIYSNRLRKRKNSELLSAQKEIKIINNNLEVKNKELEQLNSTKDKFFSIIAHDLKNPFNTLLGASQILKLDDGGMSEEDKKELIEIISNDTEKLYNLLENLLFWSRSQTGNLKAKTVDVELHNLIFEIVNLYKSSYDKKNIQVEIKIPKEFVVRFDEFMLNAIIRNLLSNAIKFSYFDGKISFSATEKDNKIYLQVVDLGMGIKEKNINKIFDESSDYKRLGTDNEKGTGLGLILCRDFAHENGAKINVTSKIDKGTTFEIVLEKAKGK